MIREFPGVTLHRGDCLEVMPTIEAGSVDAIVTDPPWMDYATRWYDATEWHAPIEYMHPQKYAGNLYAVLADNSAAIIWCRWDCFEAHADAMRQASFKVKNCVVWDKGTHTAGDLDGDFGNQHEMAILAVKGRWTRHDRREVNLWRVPHLFSRAKRSHPTEKPIALMSRAIEAVCPPGGTVLDPFVGSGTTALAALNTGRKCIGIERDDGYFDIACRRVTEALDKTALLNRTEV